MSNQPNHLIHEQSPYLLQHAHNPVDWRPWGPEALELARREDKPIFLSIGYATCHWCHVMAHESFEDLEVARALAQDFVAIKVDREERPDLDAIYMGVCQALTGHGGWPLSVFLTPEGKPFYAGTYFPKQALPGRPGFLDLLAQIARLWRDDRQRLLESGEQITQALQPKPEAGGPEPDLALMEKAYWQLTRAFDPKRGGFGQAPKFPTPHHLDFLLRWHLRQGRSQALEMVRTTLKAMRQGGIYDHLGLGFARYSVDERWLVPHFEKMLYDQALLAYAYLEAHQADSQAGFGQTAREIFTYVLRDMTAPEGGFYSAEDADSQGVEGLFHTWTPQEVEAVLGPELGGLFSRFYGVSAPGNFEHGRSVIHERMDLADFARNLGREPAELAAEMERARGMLFAARQQRPRPLKDDKVLTAWNGLMIAALAKGAQVLGDAKCLEAARRAARFVLEHLSDPDGGLLRRWRNGHTSGPGFLEDYAFFIWGLIELHQADLDPAWLAQAIRLTELCQAHFEDELHGGFFFTPHEGPSLIVRDKEAQDSALPSGNSVMAHNLARLARLTGRQEWERKAWKLLKAFAAQMARYPLAFTHLFLALDLLLGPGQEVVLAGQADDPALLAMLDALRQDFAPRRSWLLLPSGPAGQEVATLAPFTRGMGPLKGRATAYVCQDQACQQPVTSLAALKEALA